MSHNESETEALRLYQEILDKISEGITVADARLPDNPLIYINGGFERLTGYSASEVLDQNCRFMQGPETSPETKKLISAAIKSGQPCQVEIVNYRKDGTKFWNWLSLTPIRDAENRLMYFVGIQADVTARKLAEEGLQAANLRMQQNLLSAAKVQQALLPRNLPNFASLEVAYAFQPCEELAGDTLNIFPLDSANVGLYILDVSGHGVPAALLSVSLNHMLLPIPGQSILTSSIDQQGQDSRVTPPAQVVQQLNQLFPMDQETLHYFTMVYGVFNRDRRELRYVTAGHPAPILLPQNGSARLLDGSGIPVGILPQTAYIEHVIQLQPGDRVYLYTDGIYEVSNCEGEEYGLQRLQQNIELLRHEPLQESVFKLVHKVEEFCEMTPLRDDLSLLALEVR